MIGEDALKIMSFNVSMEDEFHEDLLPDPSFTVEGDDITQLTVKVPGCGRLIACRLLFEEIVLMNRTMREEIGSEHSLLLVLLHSGPVSNPGSIPGFVPERVGQGDREHHHHVLRYEYGLVLLPALEGYGLVSRFPPRHDTLLLLNVQRLRMTPSNVSAGRLGFWDSSWLLSHGEIR
ncbi:hypothetical protein SAY87_007993 [Trapa incisa]|uniref:Uncharacterized protein n=1 Tax=Trapa incisa TaxID=236973 RepID=A0AAN7QFJ4_9MYRT|nr:hypothetical protein SAY87_007993 [Trapa incisa]